MDLRIRLSIVSIAVTALVVPLTVAVPAQAVVTRPVAAVQQSDEVWEASEQQREHVPSEEVSEEA